jgi:hypothetical protein
MSYEWKSWFDSDAPDGVYVDGSYHDSDRIGAIGIVLVRNGVAKERHGDRFAGLGFLDAEMEAIDRAHEIYPSERVFSDNRQAAAVCVATWIPRENNRIAHHCAQRAYKMLPLDPFAPITSETVDMLRKERKKKKRMHGTRACGLARFCGRGCVVRE